jgi:hypothetical protein
MTRWKKKGRRRQAGVAMAGAAAGAMTLSLAVLPAGVAHADTVPGVSASFTSGVLTVRGDRHDNTIVISRDAAGTILVNGGAVPIDGAPTVANTTSMIALGSAGKDTITLDARNPSADVVDAAQEIRQRVGKALTGEDFELIFDVRSESAIKPG